MLINSKMFISIAVQSQNEIIYNNEKRPNTMQNNMITSYNHNCVKEAKLKKKKHPEQQHVYEVEFSKINLYYQKPGQWLSLGYG